MVREREGPSAPFRDAYHGAVDLLIRVTPEEWWACAEELLYDYPAKWGSHYGSFRLSLQDLDELYWGDLPGQMLWFRDRLRAHHQAEGEWLSQKEQ